MKSIVLFNNKGGVGKTTLTGNVAAYVAQKLNKRVCVIDCDPQCNVTQLILGDQRTIELYWNKSATRSKSTSSLLNVMQPILDGGAEIDADVVPFLSSENRFGVDLLPGHPQLSNVEDLLSRAWTDLTASRIGGFRITFWLNSLLRHLAPRYDYIFVDVGPSLGSINRSVLISADYIVTPLGSDIFSLLGIRNIAQWTSEWLAQYELAYGNSFNANAQQLSKYDIPREPGILHGFLGYTLQQYITKSKQGKRRATVAFEKIIGSVPREVEQYLTKLYAPNVNASSVHLGDVPNLFSIIPLAQSVSAPIFGLKSSDRLVGAQFQQALKYSELVASVSKKIVENIGD